MLSKLLTGKPTGNRFLERSRHRREDNIRINHKEIRVNTKNQIESISEKRLLGNPAFIPRFISHGESQLIILNADRKVQNGSGWSTGSQVGMYYKLRIGEKWFIFWGMYS